MTYTIEDTKFKGKLKEICASDNRRSYNFEDNIFLTF